VLLFPKPPAAGAPLPAPATGALPKPFVPALPVGPSARCGSPLQATAQTSTDSPAPDLITFGHRMPG
jgi:hypothetical protein